ncbi:MAG: PIN domain-containing protein [Dehalococcoidales bacterium]|nr:PIN domain-containing protein [Dehalococcoidales bacterium]
MYLFYTDTLSNLLRRTPSTVLIAKLASVPTDQQFTSAITLGELFYGAYRLGPMSKALSERLEKTLLPSLPVIPFDTEAAYRYGQTRAELEHKGILIGDADLRIAAIALARGLTVITGNVNHFRRVPGLPVQNWLEP